MRRSGSRSRIPSASAGRSEAAASACARGRHRGLETRRWRKLVHQSPLQRPPAADAFLGGGKEVGPVPPHLALVDDAHQSAGARQHAEERDLRQRHRARTVVDEEDPLGGHRELVAASRRGPVDRAQVALARVRARVLDRAPGLVGELAERDLARVARPAEHADVRAGAEHPLLARTDHHRRHLGMLEAQPLHRIGQLDVDPEVVGVELELVSGREAAGLVDVELQGGDAALGAQAPVTVALRRGAHVDRRTALARRRLGGFGHGFLAETALNGGSRHYHRPPASSRRSLVPCRAIL